MEKSPTTKYPTMNASADTDHIQTKCLEAQDRVHSAPRKRFAESQWMMRNHWPNREEASEGRTERGKLLQYSCPENPMNSMKLPNKKFDRQSWRENYNRWLQFHRMIRIFQRESSKRNRLMSKYLGSGLANIHQGFMPSYGRYWSPSSNATNTLDKLIHFSTFQIWSSLVSVYMYKHSLRA